MKPFIRQSKQNVVVLCFGLLAVLGVIGCSESSDGVEYLFDRTILEMFVLRECPPTSQDTSCYQLRFRHPIETKNLVRYHLWLDTTVVDDTSKSVSSSDLQHSIRIEYRAGSTDLYETFDLTGHIKPYLKQDSLQVAVWAEYNDNDEPGSVQRLYLYFGDNILPSAITMKDSVWSTGVALDWSRPTDQRDFYKPSDLSGPIVGYNILFYAQDSSEDIRNLKVRLEWEGQIDSLGLRYQRHARIRVSNDSIWVDQTSKSDDTKNYLRIAVLDGKGFNMEDPESNYLRMILEGLSPESRYTVGIVAWDSAGNSTSTASSGSVETNRLIITTDKIAPLMPTAFWIKPDSLYPDKLALDSNRLILFWSRSVDPLVENHGITVGKEIIIPKNCFERDCYRNVRSYTVESWTGSTWSAYDLAGGDANEKYTVRYALEGDSMVVSSTGTYVSDTLRWVTPGDSIILRVRSIDSSGFYSVALIDTLGVTFGSEFDLNCPSGFVPIRTNDSTRFCVERFEHLNISGVFETNMFYAEALAACEAISAPGFSVSLCSEKHWQQACLAGNKTQYGVIEEESFSAAEFLFRNCNVGTNDSLFAQNVSTRNSRCVSPDGIRDFPGNYQEWVTSDSGTGILKGSSYLYFDGIDRTEHALCVTRSYPFRNRAAYTTDTVYIYQNGVRVDTVLTKDTTRTLYKILTQKDFRDTLLIYNVKHPKTGKVLGEDYVSLKEYQRGGAAWLTGITLGLLYEETRREVVFLTGGSIQYRGAAPFFRDPSIGFRCCAYPDGL